MSSYCILSDVDIKFIIDSEIEEDRFWMEKTWMLCGSGMDQIHPNELDKVSLGIALRSDFIDTIREANEIRLSEKAK